MSLIRLRRLVAVLGLAGWIALLPGAAAAAEPFQLLPDRGLFAEAWDFFAGLLGLEDGDSGETGGPAGDLTLEGDQGATVDPNGRV